jgi:hypothetical protein
MIVLMAFLFVCCASLLAWDVRDFLFGKVDHGVHSRLEAVGYVVVAIYGFFFAYSYPRWNVKVASLLIGANYARLAIGYLYSPAVHQHSVVLSGSIATQIAFVIFLYAITEWFKSVVRRSPPTEQRGGS